MKKVLIITYYWPPSGGGGVQRWLKFVKYLPQFGWNPVVIAPENPEYPVVDETLQNDIPPEAEVIKLPIWEPYGIFKRLTGRKKTEKVNTGLLFDDRKQSITEKISLWIRGNFLIPDPRVFWVVPSVKQLKNLIPDIKPDVIITTGPPHSIHLIGLKLKKHFPEIKWLSDFRDPWAEIDYLDSFYPTKWARRRQEILEKKVLDYSDIVLTVSKSWADDLRKKTLTPVDYITNGFDPNDFPALNEKRENKRNDKFIISHIGIINSFRNPVVLWEALDELCKENEQFKEALQINVYGTTDKGLQNRLSKFYMVKQKIKINGYIPHDEVIQKYKESSCLLLLLNNSKNSKGHIPGKFFEYIASGKPVLAIAPGDSDIAEIIKENDFGEACDFNDKKAIKKAVLSFFYQNTNPPKITAITNFSRMSLTEKLINTMKN